jgi:ketosteroid isomerase-like protein
VPGTTAPQPRRADRDSLPSDRDRADGAGIPPSPEFEAPTAHIGAGCLSRIRDSAAGDFEAALGNFYDADVEWHGAAGGLDEGRVVRGQAEVVEGFRDYYDTWERLELRPEEIIDTGDELIVFVHEVARGRESGIVVETDTAAISTIHDGRVIRVRNYLDRGEALEAAGLSQ